jgi:general secretion pathway protein D
VEKNRVQVISAPKIVTMDNQAARVMVGEDFPCGSGTSVKPPVSGGIEYRPLGIQVQVLPKIGPDNTVVMRIVPEISTAVQTNVDLGNGVFARRFDVQTMETTVSVKDGETALIGGMTKLEDADTVGHCGCKRHKTDVLVFVTPHVAK